MGAPMFLAMTADEIRDISPLPSNIAHLGCSFSSDGPGLEGLPEALPPLCGLVIDDRQFMKAQPAGPILEQLSILKPAFVLLDFQRPPEEHSLRLAAEFTAADFPTALPPAYSGDRNCPVFLPPVPPHIPVSEYLEPWGNREVWLELALDAVQITVTAQGSRITPLPHAKAAENAHADRMLHCHYKITQKADALEFYCFRTRKDIDALLAAPLPPNVTHTIGLYQELGGA